MAARIANSRERDFDGYGILRVVGLHVPAVLGSELLKDLVELCLLGKKMGTRCECLPSGAEADGRLLAQVFAPLRI